MASGGEDEAARPLASGEDAVAGDGPRDRRGEKWGHPGYGWELAEIWSKKKGCVIGYGATCRNHLDHADPPGTVCKKSVTIGKSGLTIADLKLRMKRWLIAGLDDAEWEEDVQRSTHVRMGKTYMQEFAHGLSEEECDRIAHAEA